MSKSKYKKTLASTVVAASLLLSGCGLFGMEEKEKIDPPEEVTYTEEQTEVTEKTTNNEKEAADQTQEAETSETVKTELYLVDKNGYVVPQTLELPKTESVATQALEYLVKNGPVTEMLPNGFQAVIPDDTKISVNVKDKVATVDFSSEFKDYKAEDELKILQSITWTLTQFDSIEQVKLQMNGHPLEEMPVNGTPIGDELTRKDGINIDTSQVADITNTKPVTVYYIGGEADSYYFVPVTKRVSNKIENNIDAAINELIKGPSVASHLLNEFNSDVELLGEPKVENGKVTLNFNESIFGSFDKKMISQNVLDSLVLTLTEQQGIESVVVTVNGKAELMNEEGKKLTEPVTRPENVNTGSF
ncbi:GerMN domain-containing protein [Niallia endozanthoxylica]|uniref:Sporulation protein n=1 Tax=Niallia endozanthoxylica TaxID=2036016 RepID=A0A5J5HQ98_9BACI|nr:GerMN domain-containing protein [Niallia endozanthoxylica]KAA9023172.1 sporulation protein [Niallia endozanthoxylica]